MSEQKKKLVPCGAMWKGKQGGQVLLSGVVDLPDGTKLRIKMLRNAFKKEDKHPDYRLVTEVDDDAPAAHGDSL